MKLYFLESMIKIIKILIYKYIIRANRSCVIGFLKGHFSLLLPVNFKSSVSPELWVYTNYNGTAISDQEVKRRH